MKPKPPSSSRAVLAGLAITVLTAPAVAGGAVAQRTHSSAGDRAAEKAFVDALIRIRRESGTYQINERAVSLEESTLFQTRVELPSTLVEGTYITRIYLTREGRVIDRYESHLPVYKVGVERWVHLLAVEQPLVTGLLALMVAVVAGWGASALFRSLRL